MNVQLVLGNFALVLFVLMIGTGIIWFLDVFYLAKQRRKIATAALEAFDARNARLSAEGIKPDMSGRAELEARLMQQPTWIEYSGSFFPVIAAVFFLRSFLFEPFRIPSSSMVPTLLHGDMILVNKYVYGIRLPIINKKIIDVNDPARGDVMVFRFPVDPSKDYIKRVIGIPGDKIAYKNKRLTVNGEALSYEALPNYEMVEDIVDENGDPKTDYRVFKQYSENLTGVKHSILVSENSPGLIPQPTFPRSENCTRTSEGLECTVPAGHYFMMGDNRDNSEDSRYWGFVPEQNIVGKAFYIWMHFRDFSVDFRRIGSFQ